jgi:hypothetical protein
MMLPSRSAVVGVRWAIGLGIFTALLTLTVQRLVLEGRPSALLALLPVPLALWWRRSHVTAGALIVSSVVLQLSYIGIDYADQVDLGRAALSRVLDGESPYGEILVNREGGLNPFAYGPLAMLTAIPGEPLEMAACAGLLMLVGATRSWLTLGFLAAFPPIVASSQGGNDYVPALLLTGGLLALRSHPRMGMVVIAVAAAVKPYAAAWFLPAIGYAGWAGMWLIGTCVVLWSPVLAWGIGNYIESLRLVYLAQPPGTGSHSIPLPWVRILSAPIAISGLFVHRWEFSVLIGSTAYIAVMFFGEWGTMGYWIAVLPITGIALERLIVSATAERPDAVAPQSGSSST